MRRYQWGGACIQNGRADRRSVVYLLVRLDSGRRTDVRNGRAAETLRRSVGIGTRNAMPSLVRFLSVIAIVAAVIYAGVYVLAHFVQPKPREISVSIPPEKFFKNRQGP